MASQLGHWLTTDPYGKSYPFFLEVIEFFAGTAIISKPLRKIGTEVLEQSVKVAAKTSTQTFKSVGAAGKQVFNPKIFKGVSESLLKRNGISDIHAFKAEWLGTDKGLKLFDVVKHTGSNELLIIRKSTQEVVERTYKIIK